MSKQKNNVYSDEFKQEAVRQALKSGKPKAQVARELGVAISLLYGWIKKFDEAKSKGLTPKELDSEKAEFRRLQAENKRLKEEVEILKKASAYFAKHQK
jgi:transposase